MKYFPLFLELRDQSVLIVGGGLIAARRCTAVTQAGARVSSVTTLPWLAFWSSSRA